MLKVIRHEGNATQNDDVTMLSNFVTMRTATTRKTKVGEDVEKLDPSHLGAAAVENGLAAPRKAKHGNM